MMSWSLRNSWSAPADIDALACCRDELARHGVEFESANPLQRPSATKMHGMEIVEAMGLDAAAWSDLRGAAATSAWDRTVPAFLQRYMRYGDGWYGIPMGIHRAGISWINQRVASQAAALPEDPAELVSWLRVACGPAAKPLATGGEPSQVGALFESVLLGLGGPGLYRSALEDLDLAAWRDPSMLAVMKCMMDLREFVDDRLLGLDSAGQLARVRRGEAAIHVMADWLRADAGGEIVEWPVPGTQDCFVFVADFFVPGRGPGSFLSDRVASVLTSPTFQNEFSRRKGCIPAVRTAWHGLDTTLVDLFSTAAVLPSFAFDQSCAMTVKRPLLRSIADHFVRRSVPYDILRSAIDAIKLAAPS